MRFDAAPYFTRRNGDFLCARWGRPIAPVIFGVDDATLGVFRQSLDQLLEIADWTRVDCDPETAANLLIFFCADWQELKEVPNIAHLVDDFEAVLRRMGEENAHEFRIFRFDATGAIRAAIVFLRMDEALLAQPLETLSLYQMLRIMASWSEGAFDASPPISSEEPSGPAQPKPEISALLRALYDQSLPSSARDQSFALRLNARVERLMSQERS